MSRRRRRSPVAGPSWTAAAAGDGMAPRKSGVELLFHEELLAAIRARLLSGWVLVHGPSEALTHLEQEVYKPGTDANAGYEIFLGTGNGKLLPIHLIRKTMALQRFLEKGGNPPEEFEDLIFLEFGPVFENQAPVILTRLREMSLETWVDSVLASIDISTGGSP